MTVDYKRQAATFRNEMRQQCGALLGIASGLLADGELNDREITFLRDWLNTADNVRLTWPGDVIYGQLQSYLQDGAITEDERTHLVSVLRNLIGGSLDDLADGGHVTSLALDEVDAITVPGSTFCLTGDFVFSTRKACELEIQRRDGIVLPNVTKKLQYLVVGGLGSPEWKHGGFGTKIERAIELKRAGTPILIVHEDVWSASIFG